jgi:hypothetical protein
VFYGLGQVGFVLVLVIQLCRDIIKTDGDRMEIVVQQAWIQFYKPLRISSFLPFSKKRKIYYIQIKQRLFSLFHNNLENILKRMSYE